MLCLLSSHWCGYDRAPWWPGWGGGHGAVERKKTAVVISAKAADQGRGCEGLPREGERLVFSLQDSGCFAESHGGEADLSLLALSEFPADLGSVLQQRVL